jgi:KUP system potassium uptake protein
MLLVTEVQPKYWRATARFHFMEKPDSPALLKQACLQNLLFDLGIFHTYVESSPLARGFRSSPAQ